MDSVPIELDSDVYKIIQDSKLKYECDHLTTDQFLKGMLDVVNGSLNDICNINSNNTQVKTEVLTEILEENLQVTKLQIPEISKADEFVKYTSDIENTKMLGFDLQCRVCYEVIESEIGLCTHFYEKHSGGDGGRCNTCGNFSVSSSKFLYHDVWCRYRKAAKPKFSISGPSTPAPVGFNRNSQIPYRCFDCQETFSKDTTATKHRCEVQEPLDLSMNQRSSQKVPDKETPIEKVLSPSCVQSKIHQTTPPPVGYELEIDSLHQNEVLMTYTDKNICGLNADSSSSNSRTESSQRDTKLKRKILDSSNQEFPPSKSPKNQPPTSNISSNLPTPCETTPNIDDCINMPEKPRENSKNSPKPTPTKLGLRSLSKVRTEKNTAEHATSTQLSNSPKPPTNLTKPQSPNYSKDLFKSSKFKQTATVAPQRPTTRRSTAKSAEVAKPSKSPPKSAVSTKKKVLKSRKKLRTPTHSGSSTEPAYDDELFDGDMSKSSKTDHQPIAYLPINKQEMNKSEATPDPVICAVATKVSPNHQTSSDSLSDHSQVITSEVSSANDDSIESCNDQENIDCEGYEVAHIGDYTYYYKCGICKKRFEHYLAYKYHNKRCRRKSQKLFALGQF